MFPFLVKFTVTFLLCVTSKLERKLQQPFKWYLGKCLC
uniref:Uncharacterized protein n=1 Tax=Arundo donax TaxID=35708 RepID=A0A0A9HCC1_ARUDO